MMSAAMQGQYACASALSNLPLCLYGSALGDLNFFFGGGREVKVALQMSLLH